MEYALPYSEPYPPVGSHELQFHGFPNADQIPMDGRTFWLYSNDDEEPVPPSSSLSLNSDQQDTVIPPVPQPVTPVSAPTPSFTNSRKIKF